MALLKVTVCSHGPHKLRMAAAVPLSAGPLGPDVASTSAPNTPGEDELLPTMTGAAAAKAKAQPKAAPLPVPQIAAPILLVPQRLVDQVNAGRPVCLFYTRPQSCKKGNKCPQRHVGDLDNEHRMPGISIACTKDGSLKCTLRPPIDEYWERLFKDAGVARRVLRLHHSKHMFIILFNKRNVRPSSCNMVGG